MNNLELEGPHFNTTGWDQDHNGVHPVEMLARIAKFENKAEPKYDPYRGRIRNRGSHDCRKVVVCCYDGFQVLGNGKLEKQAKLVAARNMIVKIKTVNIGIVNETLAKGVTVDLHNKETNPHKKPLVRQFKSFTSGGTLGTFKSAGTLGSSFVAASSSSNEVVTPPAVCSVKDTDNLEIEQYKAYVEGKIESPQEKLPPENDSSGDTSAGPAPEPKIVFKRAANNDGTSEEPDVKKPKADDNVIDNFEDTKEESHVSSGSNDWDPSNYGYQCNNQQQPRGRAWRGTFNGRGFNKNYYQGGGYNYRGRGGGYGYGGYGYRGGWS